MKTATSLFKSSLLLSALVVPLVHCGGDDDHKGNSTSNGGSAGNGAANPACLTQCDQEVTAGCLTGTLDDCKNNCVQLQLLPAACLAAMNQWTECLVNNNDPCVRANPSPCATEEDAFVAAC